MMTILEVRWKRCLVMALMIIPAAFLFAGTVSAASDGGHGENGAKGWVATDTYRVLNFAVLAIALFFILRKPVSKALTSRIEGIRDQLNDLEDKKKEAEKQLAAYEEKLAHLNQEAKKVIAEYIRQGTDAKARILSEAENAALRLEEQARRNIENEFEQAKLRLQEEIMDKALLKAQEIIKDKITSEDQDKLVAEYLKKVVES